MPSQVLPMTPNQPHRFIWPAIVIGAVGVWAFLPLVREIGLVATLPGVYMIAFGLLDGGGEDDGFYP